jgi:hypothetical protein
MLIAEKEWDPLAPHLLAKSVPTANYDGGKTLAGFICVRFITADLAEAGTALTDACHVNWRTFQDGASSAAGTA